jgi:hypothetical protein
MAYIGHRCGCGHMDINHDPDAKKNRCKAAAGASCSKGCRKSAKSIVRPTFDIKAQPVERIVPPGERIAAEGTTPYTPKTCDCDSCQALYAELTAA